jgi:nicotinamidase-related amidase
VKDALLVIDVISEFDHEDGDVLLASFRKRLPRLQDALARARAAGVPVVYVNDQHGRWDGDAPGLVRRALAGTGGDVAEVVAPRSGEAVILKPRYSAFDRTPVSLLLEQLGVERLLMVGGATEACIVQSGIDARELGYKVTIIAGACAAIDEELEQLSLRYAVEVAGMYVVDDYASA